MVLRASQMILICLLAFPGLVFSDDCAMISVTELEGDIASKRAEGEGVTPVITLSSQTVNCQVVGTVRGTYSVLSITASFSSPQFNSEVARIKLTCVVLDGDSDWQPNDLDVITNSDRRQELLNSSTLSNCYGCSADETEGDYGCQACNPACNTGLGYCTGSGSSHCCSFYDEGSCVASCGSNSFGNSSFDCVCDQFYQEPDCTVCTLQQSDCQNGGTVDISSCVCNCNNTGYSGLLCTEDINECTTIEPCNDANSISCTNNNGSYVCECKNGFNGTNCDNNIEDCTSSSCANGGTCVDGVASFTCECPPGYTEDDCSVDINECETDPCQNGGACTDRINSYTCSCVPQYHGSNCENDVDECITQSPCQNGGSCRNTFGGYECSCVGQWTDGTCNRCYIENCISPSCNGSRFECLECVNRYTPKHPDNSQCVLCTIGNCTSCSSHNVCVECAHGLVTNGTVCQPPTVRRQVSTLDVGIILAIIITLCVLIAVVIAVIVILIFISLRIRAKKPIQYGAKNPIEHKEPIVLQKISNI